MMPALPAKLPFSTSSDPETAVRDCWMWFLLIVAGSADCVTTWIGLSMGFTESNPFVRPLLAMAGVPGLVILKALVILGVFLFVRRLPRPAPSIAANTISLIWTLAVGINIAGILSGAPV